MFCQCSPVLSGFGILQTRVEAILEQNHDLEEETRVGFVDAYTDYRGVEEAARKLGRGFWYIEFQVAKVCFDFSLFLLCFAFSSPPFPHSSPSGIFSPSIASQPISDL